MGYKLFWWTRVGHKLSGGNLAVISFLEGLEWVVSFLDGLGWIRSWLDGLGPFRRDSGESSTSVVV
jgi:hypothetical protein